MNICSNCNAQLDERMVLCPYCGAKEIKQVAGTQTNANIGQPMGTISQDALEQKDIEDNKAMAILAYFFFPIPLLTAKESTFARFHTNQVIVIFIISTILGIVFTPLAILSITAPPLLILILIVGSIMGVGISILSIMGFIDAIRGTMKPLPIIGKIKILGMKNISEVKQSFADATSDAMNMASNAIHNKGNGETFACPSCGNHIGKGKKFCAKCGFKIVTESNSKIMCSSCGTPIEKNKKFCGSCGNPAPEPPKAKICATCGTKIDDDKKFCSDCGTPIADIDNKPSSCTQCGEKIADGKKFCGSCGTPVKGA